jgi:hypothetical protein
MLRNLVLHRPDVRIEIDLNSRSRDGYTLARLSRADGPVLVDDDVVVFEPDDRVAAPARVVRVDREHDFAFLDVDWSLLREDLAYGKSPRPILSGVIGRLSNSVTGVTMRIRETQQTWIGDFVEVAPRPVYGIVAP